MKKLLQRWHWLHTWTRWETTETAYIFYPWTKPGHYASKVYVQNRDCEVCGKKEIRKTEVM